MALMALASSTVKLTTPTIFTSNPLNQKVRASPTVSSKNFQNREAKIKIPQKNYINLQQIPHFREFNIKYIIKIFKTLLLPINF